MQEPPELWSGTAWYGHVPAGPPREETAGAPGMRAGSGGAVQPAGLRGALPPAASGRRTPGLVCPPRGAADPLGRRSI